MATIRCSSSQNNWPSRTPIEGFNPKRKALTVPGILQHAQPCASNFLHQITLLRLFGPPVCTVEHGMLSFLLSLNCTQLQS
jgi:hypothetical protein